jgi:hypothetical protein
VNITCMTTQAATQVMTILFTAGWCPRQDFMIGPAFAVEPPLIFTILRPLTDDFLVEIGAIPGVRIAS